MPEDRSQDVDSYQQELGERIGDGGGCAETWEALSDSRGEEGQKTRRTFLQMISAGALGTGSLANLPQIARGQPNEDALHIEPLSGGEERRAVGTASRQREFRTLRKFFASQHGLFVDSPSVEAYRVKTDSHAENEMVVFPLVSRGRAGKSRNDEGGTANREAEIVIGLQDGTLFDYKAHITAFSEDGETAQLISFSVSKEDSHEAAVTEETAEVDLSEYSVTTQDDGGVQIQQSLSCTICLEIGGFVCRNSCALSAFAICLAITFVTGPGGVICAATAIVLCDYINQNSDIDVCIPADRRQACEEVGRC